MSLFEYIRKYRILVGAVHELYLVVEQHNPHQKGHHMDPLSEIAAIKTKVVALQGSQSTTPTTNFVTPDVQSALDDLATTAGVSLTAPAPTPAPTS